MNRVSAVLVCPHCKRLSDLASSADPEFQRPEPGDYSVCWRCAEVSRVSDQGTLRLMTAEEAADVKDDHELNQYRWHVLTSRTPSEAISRVER